MNYIREAENILENYRGLKSSLSTIESQIERLKMEGRPKDIKAISYDGMPSAGRQKDEAINIFYKIKCYMDMQEKTKREIEFIEGTLDDLDQDNEGYGRILTLWYVEQQSKEEIANQLGYARSNVYNIKNKAIRKFAIMHFGINALIAI